MTLPISACIITLNEEDNIDRCLSSLDFTNEIIIVDSGSIDKTIEIASKYNAAIYTRKFDNYVNQKNFCISKAKNEWVLSLDADEAISPELKSELLLLAERDFSCNHGFEVPRITFYLGRWIRHGGWYPNTQIRLFQKSKGQFKGFLVHERVVVEGNIKSFKHPILHYSYRNISDHLKFIDRYSNLAAAEKHALGQRSGVLLSLAKAFWKFFYMYIIRFGFLDGKAGLVVAVLGGYYNFLKYIKLYELGLKESVRKERE